MAEIYFKKVLSREAEASKTNKDIIIIIIFNNLVITLIEEPEDASRTLLNSVEIATNRFSRILAIIWKMWI